MGFSVSSKVLPYFHQKLRLVFQCTWVDCQDRRVTAAFVLKRCYINANDTRPSLDLSVAQVSALLRDHGEDQPLICQLQFAWKDKGVPSSVNKLLACCISSFDVNRLLAIAACHVKLSAKMSKCFWGNRFSPSFSLQWHFNIALLKPLPPLRIIKAFPRSVQRRVSVFTG